MEIPADAEPKDSATVTTGIDKRVNGIVGGDIPSSCIERIGEKHRQIDTLLWQLLSDADIAGVIGLGGELREVLWRG